MINSKVDESVQAEKDWYKLFKTSCYMSPVYVKGSVMGKKRKRSERSGDRSNANEGGDEDDEDEDSRQSKKRKMERD